MERFNFAETLKEVGKIATKANVKQVIEVINNRIKRCEELLVYVNAMSELTANNLKPNRAANIAADIQSIVAELVAWEVELPAIDKYESLWPILLEVKVLYAERVNVAKQKLKELP